MNLLKKIFGILYHCERILLLIYQEILKFTLIFSKKKKIDYKIFCIGFPKTGTTSLAKALKILGYRTLDFPRGFITPKEGWVNYFKKSKFDAFSDAPLNDINLIKKLDKIFPNSKFIFTVRNEEDLIKSWKTFFYGTVYAIDSKKYEQYIRDSYKNHNKNVLNYFKDKKSRFLQVNIFENDSWTEICNFLGCKEPDNLFPHKNKNHYRKLIVKKILLR